MAKDDFIIQYDDRILITGANGFIGSKVVETFLRKGFKKIRCFVRPSSSLKSMNRAIDSYYDSSIEIYKGNLLSHDDCINATRDVKVIIHLAAGIDKSFPGAYLNSVVATRNLLEATIQLGDFKRFLNVSSFAVYSNLNKKRGSLLDESCEIDDKPELRYEAYTYGKIKQDELLLEYCVKYDIPYVIVRPSVVFGPGKKFIPSRVGIGTFGFFMHLGGNIQIPLTYIDNCADAIVLASLTKGIESEILNIVDDNLPKSRDFLQLYKKHVERFKSIYIPYRLFYMFCYLWERYSLKSEGQLPPVFNRRKCEIYWKGNKYSNQKIKCLLGWKPVVPFNEALTNYFSYQKEAGKAND